MPKNPDLGSDADRVRKEEQARIDEAEQLSEAELSEKEDLLREVGLVLIDVAQSSHCIGGTFLATAGFQDSDIFQTAIKIVLRCILSPFRI